MPKSCKHDLAFSPTLSIAETGPDQCARPELMSIIPPKQVAPYRGRDRDCEAAVLPAFDELIENLVRSGVSEKDVAGQLGRALDSPATNSALGDDLEMVKEWATHAGWEPSEVDRAFLTLSEIYYARFRDDKDGAES